MNEAGDWVTIAVAVIGSTALSTVVSVILGRFAHDRDQQQFQSWKVESELLEAIIKQIDDEKDQELKSSRTVLKEVVSARHNQKNVQAIIPKRRASYAGQNILAFAVVILGLVLLAASGSVGPDSLQWPAAIFTLSGFLLWVVTTCEEMARSKMRASLLAAIQGKYSSETGPTKYGKSRTRFVGRAWNSQLHPFQRWIVAPDTREIYDLLLEQIADIHAEEKMRTPG